MSRCCRTAASAGFTVSASSLRGRRTWLAGGWLLLMPLAASAAAGSAAEIVALTGKGEFREAAEGAWSAARIRQALPPASFIRTGDLSSMSILLTDQTQIKLGQNSTFQIRSVASAGPSRGQTQLNLQRGKAWSQTKNAGDGLYVRTPSAIAGIHGTDWVIEVDDSGRTELLVLSGVVELSNEHGRVQVGRNELAEALPGQAPSKRPLVRFSERVQWVSTRAFDPLRYELDAERTQTAPDVRQRLDAAVAAIAAGEHAAAVGLLEQAMGRGSPLPELLAADFAMARGELAPAARWLAQGRARFPGDARFPVAEGFLAILQGDLAGAGRFLSEASALGGPAALTAVLAGELARLNGDFAGALDAYGRAAALQPTLPDGWSGRGGIRLEQEDVAAARRDLNHALRLRPDDPTLLAELGTLESLANRLDVARQHFEAAVRAAPGDYVAMTGLGLLELKAGHPEQAMAWLLRANAIEPRHARSVLYLGVAYHRMGNPEAALSQFVRAAELDPKDPVPHLMASLVHQDQRNPAASIEAAQAAVLRMPFLKSMNQIANDQKGSASLGGAVAFFGLEDWAMAQARRSYYPYAGGGQLFHADRLDGKLVKNAELMQGFLADPTVFGADPRRQTLLMQPGHHLAVGGRVVSSRAGTLFEPALAANGYANANVPMAYFLEGVGDRYRPGDLAFDGRTRNFTMGFGLRPNFETGVFVFGNRFSADLMDRALPGEANAFEGATRRLDVGLSYRFAPRSQLWLKVGGGDGDVAQQLEQRDAAGTADTRITQAPRDRDLQVRHTLALGERVEFAYGFEASRARFALDSVTWASGASSGLATRMDGEVRERDASSIGYVSWRHRLHPALLVQGDLFWQRQRKSIDELERVVQGGEAFRDQRGWQYRDAGWFPRAGLEFVPNDALALRVAYQHWRRPISYSTLAPVTTAGVSLSDRLVLPGGEQRVMRGQGDWQLGPRTLLAAFAERSRVDNLHLKGDQPDNRRQELADLDRLRVGRMPNLGNLETLEARPVFSEGRVRAAGFSVNHVLDTRVTGHAGYVHTLAENVSPWFAGLRLPYLPKRKFVLGVTWAATTDWMIQWQAVHRSQRFTDEANTHALSAGWDGAMRIGWRSPDRSVAVELQALNLFQSSDRRSLGIGVTLRY